MLMFVAAVDMYSDDNANAGDVVVIEVGAAVVLLMLMSTLL